MTSKKIKMSVRRTRVSWRIIVKIGDLVVDGSVKARCKGSKNH